MTFGLRSTAEESSEELTWSNWPQSRRSARKDPDLASANPWADVHELQASLAALRDGGSALHIGSGGGRRDD